MYNYGMKTKTKLKSDSAIIDVPLAKTKNMGTAASAGDIDYHYQNYANVWRFLKNMGSKDIYVPKSAFLNLDLSDIERGIYSSNMKSILSGIATGISGKSQFIPIILNLITDEGAHANIILINKKDHVFELYEPHGARTSSSVLSGVVGAYKKKLRLLNSFVSTHFPAYKVVNSVDSHRGTSFQMLRDPEKHSGFCVTWSILFVHYRILNPTIKLKTLIKYIAKNISTAKLLRYAKYIEYSVKDVAKKAQKKKAQTKQAQKKKAQKKKAQKKARTKAQKKAQKKARTKKAAYAISN
jgi:hypothetical protein